MPDEWDIAIDSASTATDPWDTSVDTAVADSSRDPWDVAIDESSRATYVSGFAGWDSKAQGVDTNYAKKLVGSQAKGWMKFANTLLKIPTKILGEPMPPEKVKEIEAYLKETYGEDAKFSPTSVTPKYMKLIDDHTKGMESIIKSHPEWEREAPRGFKDLVTSPEKLSLAIADAIPLMTAAGITTAAGAPTVAFCMIYDAEGQ